MITFASIRYEATRYNLLGLLEECGLPKSFPYLDGRQAPKMGVGFRLRDDRHIKKILETMGFRVPGASPAEQAYIDQIRAAVDMGYSCAQTAADLHAKLDAVMRRWAADTSMATVNLKSKRSTFTLDSREIFLIFNLIAPECENLVAAWQSRYALPDVPESRERAALFSLAWNSLDNNSLDNHGERVPDLLGAGLARAVLNGDRSQAWFEIRYNSNRDALKGIARRRFLQSEMFGLCVNPEAMTEVEATAVRRMLQKHHSDIYTYEALFGLTRDGKRGTPLSSDKSALELAIADHSTIMSVLHGSEAGSKAAGVVSASDRLFAWVNNHWTSSVLR